MTPEEAQFCSDLRNDILANQSAGRPPHAGIDKERLAQAVAYCRSSYVAAQGKSKASGVSAPGPAVDLDALFNTVTDKKSGK